MASTTTISSHIFAAVFQDGTVDIFAQETTKPGDAVIAAPDGSSALLTIRRPHPGTVQLVVVVPGYDDWILSEKEFHNDEKISWAGTAQGALPVDWYSESNLEMTTRQTCIETWDTAAKICEEMVVVDAN